MGEIALLSLGSNLGNREENLKTALGVINSRCGNVQRISRIYETPPWGFEADQQFLNLCAAVETNLNPKELLSVFLEIEKEMGRIRQNSDSYTSRPIDIDIISFGERIVETDVLSIPHPRMEMRKFVLLPLQEIAPDFHHPKTAKTIQQIIADCQDVTTVKLYESKY